MSKQPMIPPGNVLAFSLVTMLFLIWGIPNNLNDILIKQFMKSFELTRFQAVLVQSAFYLGYFCLAVPSGLIMKRYSYKAGLVIGLFLFSIGCFLFWPAAVVGKYGLFLLALFVIASGLSFLETGANSFVVELGPSESAERRINLAQAFNPFGAILGVLIGTVFILSGIENDPAHIAALKAGGTYDAYLHKETMRVVTPYLVLAVFGLVWAICMIATKFPKVRDEVVTETGPRGDARELAKKPHFIGGVFAQFFYVGAQVCTWSFFIQYVQDYTGEPEKTAGYFLTGTLVAFLLGRFSATWFMRFTSPSRLMGLYALINVALVGVAILLPGQVGVWALFLTSFFMSLMYPTIFALGIRDLGPNTKVAGGILVMAIIGGAAFPPLMGLIAVHTHSMALAEIVPLVAYVFIAWYAYKGAALGAQKPVLKTSLA
jgi:FHS family L-fucose permease-like MFS transporter